MSLRTYPLIAHPAFIDYISNCLQGREPSDRADISHYVDRPILNKIGDISAYLGVAEEIIWEIILRPSRHYRTFSIRKRSGSIRLINAPRTFLKVAQWWIYDAILSREIVSDNAHGFIKGRWALTNAKVHLGARHLLNVDIKDFFPSITSDAVINAFKACGYNESVAQGLSRLTTLIGSLPQGAPTSPALSNIIFRDTDHNLSHYAALRGFTYSRYADDITLSSLNKISTDTIEDISQIIANVGLQLNPAKTKFMGPSSRLEITGLVLGSESVNISRKYLNSARGWFHSAAVRPENYTHERNKIAGTISMIRSVGGAQSKSTIEIGLTALSRIDSHRSSVA